ncbi:MAG: TIR domain-containing protein [Alphaproteobacteria bacterium]|nr:TIR domain-containing protein [Alphaproteobacteria bacterium]
MSDAPTSPEPDTPQPTRVFLSYSRKDEVFMRRLATALHERGYAPDFDQSDYDPDNISGGISAEDEWWQRLEQMIVAADVMVFIVSPDSAASKVCDEEIAFAREVGKRLIAVECRPVDRTKVPPALAARQIGIKFLVDGVDRFDEALEKLCAAINKDVPWHRENRRLTELAIKWDGEGRPDDRVLSAADIRATETHFERRSRNEAPPANVLADFLDHSRTKREEERNRLRRTTGLAFVKPAEETIATGEFERALRFSAAGILLADDQGGVLLPELQSSLARAKFSNRTLAILHGHTARVNTAAFGMLDKLVITASRDETARVWDARTGRCSFSPMRHEAEVTGAAFFRSKALALTTTAAGEMIIWNFVNNEPIAKWRLEARKRIEFARLSPSDEMVAFYCREGGRLRLQKTFVEAEVDIEASSTELTDAQFSKCGSMLLIGSATGAVSVWKIQEFSKPVQYKQFRAECKIVDVGWCFNDAVVTCLTIGGNVEMWHLATERRLSTRPNEGASTLSVSENGNLIATGASNGSITIWDSRNGTVHATLLGHEAGITSAHFSRCQRKLVTGSHDHTARIFDAYRNAVASAAPEVPECTNRHLLSPDFRQFLTVSTPRNFGHDATSSVVADAFSGAPLARIEHRLGLLKDVLFCNDGRYLLTVPASINPDPDITRGPRIWHCGTGDEVSCLSGHGVGWGVTTFSPDAKLIVRVRNDRVIQAWEVETGKLLRECDPGFSIDIECYARSRARAALYSSSQHKLYIWNYHDNRVEAEIFVGHRQLTSLALSDEAHLVAGANGYGRLVVWEANTGHAVLKASIADQIIQKIFFDREGKQIAVLGHGDIAFIFDLQSKCSRGEFKRHSGRITSLAFSPDGSCLGLLEEGGLIRLWSLPRRIEIARIDSASAIDGWDGLKFSPCGRFISSGRLMWDVSDATSAKIGFAYMYLSNGLARLQYRDKEDILLKGLADDLLDLAANSFSSEVHGEDVESLGAPLHRKDGSVSVLRHENCYLSPSAFAEKFGLARPDAAAFDAQDIEPADGSWGEPLAGGREGLTDIGLPNVGQRETPRVNQAATTHPCVDPAWHTPAALLPKRRWWHLARKPAKQGRRAAITEALANLPADAPIRTLTGSKGFEDRLAAYEATNAKAVNAQTAYKRWGGVALGLATVATLIAAATLLPVSALVPVEADRYVSGLQAAANILALLIVWWLGRAGAIDRWLTTRAEAERLRGQLFADLLAAPAPPGSDVNALWSQKLALFNAAHVDYQRRYLAGARKRHTKAAAGLSWPRPLAFGATALSIVVGACAFFGVWPYDLLTLAPWLKLAEEPVRWQLGLGTLASGLLAYASARTLIHQDERNAALYRHTGARLDELVAAEGKAAEDAAARGDGVAVIDYAQAAQAILDADHTAWQFHRPPRDPVGSAPGVKV